MADLNELLAKARKQKQQLSEDAEADVDKALPDEKQNSVHEGEAKEADLEDSTPAEDDLLGQLTDAEDVETDEDELEPLTKEEVHNESLSDDQLRQILIQNGMSPSDKNLQTLKEGVMSGKYSLVEEADDEGEPEGEAASGVHEGEAKEADLEKDTPDEKEVLGTETDAEDVETDEDELEPLKKEDVHNEAFETAMNNLFSFLKEEADDEVEPEGEAADGVHEGEAKEADLEKDTPDEDDILGQLTDAEDVETDEDELEPLTDAEIHEALANMSREQLGQILTEAGYADTDKNVEILLNEKFKLGKKAKIGLAALGALGALGGGTATVAKTQSNLSPEYAEVWNKIERNVNTFKDKAISHANKAADAFGSAITRADERASKVASRKTQNEIDYNTAEKTAANTRDSKKSQNQQDFDDAVVGLTKKDIDTSGFDANGNYISGITTQYYDADGNNASSKYHEATINKRNADAAADSEYNTAKETAAGIRRDADAAIDTEVNNIKKNARIAGYAVPATAVGVGVGATAGAIAAAKKRKKKTEQEAESVTDKKIAGAGPKPDEDEKSKDQVAYTITYPKKIGIEPLEMNVTNPKKSKFRSERSAEKHAKEIIRRNNRKNANNPDKQHIKESFDPIDLNLAALDYLYSHNKKLNKQNIALIHEAINNNILTPYYETYVVDSNLLTESGDGSKVFTQYDMLLIESSDCAILNEFTLNPVKFIKQKVEDVKYYKGIGRDGVKRAETATVRRARLEATKNASKFGKSDEEANKIGARVAKFTDRKIQLNKQLNNAEKEFENANTRRNELEKYYATAIENNETKANNAAKEAEKQIDNHANRVRDYNNYIRDKVYNSTPYEGSGNTKLVSDMYNVLDDETLGYIRKRYPNLFNNLQDASEKIAAADNKHAGIENALKKKVITDKNNAITNIGQDAITNKNKIDDKYNNSVTKTDKRINDDQDNINFIKTNIALADTNKTLTKNKGKGGVRNIYYESLMLLLSGIPANALLEYLVQNNKAETDKNIGILAESVFSGKLSLDDIILTEDAESDVDNCLPEGETASGVHEGEAKKADLEDSTPDEDDLLGQLTDAEDVETDEDELEPLTKEEVHESFKYSSLQEAAEAPEGYFDDPEKRSKLDVQMACEIAKDNDDLLYGELQRAIAEVKALKDKILDKYSDVAKQRTDDFVNNTRALSDDVKVKKSMFAPLGEQITINNIKKNLKPADHKSTIYESIDIFDDVK